MFQTRTQHRRTEMNTLREKARKKYSDLPTYWPATKRRSEHVRQSFDRSLDMWEGIFCDLNYTSTTYNCYMQSHELICIKVRICDKHADHIRRKCGILGNNHVLVSSDTSNTQKRAKVDDALFRSSVDTAQLVTASIRQNTFIEDKADSLV